MKGPRGADMTIDLKKYIRDVPNYPKESIVFRDIAPLLADPEAFNHAVDMIAKPWLEEEIDSIGMLDARGFIFGTAVASDLGLPFFMIRKQGKLPPPVLIEQYSLEYGGDCITISPDAVKRGDRVLLLDDVLATGGTAAAAARLIAKAGGEVVGLAALIELSYCPGRAMFKHPVTACVVY